MVWQEFMFGGDMVPGDLAFQQNVREEATQQMKRLRDHPSIVLWCGNNEIEAGWVAWADRLSFKESITPPQRDRVWEDYVVLFHDIIKSVVENTLTRPLLAKFTERKLRRLHQTVKTTATCTSGMSGTG